MAVLIGVTSALPAIGQEDLTGGRGITIYNHKDFAINQKSETGIDTTDASKYYPLNVGDVREYQFSSGIREDKIVKDTTAIGFRYFVVETRFKAVPEPAQISYVRYDTLSSSIRSLMIRNNNDDIDVPYLLGCPLSSDFNSGPIECELGSAFVSGQYDGILVFGGADAGTGTDTVQTPVKSFQLQGGFEFVYAAEIGVTVERGEGTFFALRYASVGGVEYGEPLFPTVIDDSDVTTKKLALKGWPNPSTSIYNVVVDRNSGQELELRILSSQGRLIETIHSNINEIISINVTNYASGIYFVNLIENSAITASTIMTVVR